MKIWTFLEMSTKVLTDFDLLDESWVSPNELAGYFNEAIEEAESEIITIKEDYFLTRAYVPVVAGIGQYNLPTNIYATKIRSMIYANGSLIYDIVRYRRRFKFASMALTDQFGIADDYRYTLRNDIPGQSYIELHPVSRDTAVLTPASSLFAPVILDYIRRAHRIPMLAFGTNLGEYCNPEVILPTAINTSTNVLTVGAGTYSAGTTSYGVPQRGVPGPYPGSIYYVTGDLVKFALSPGGTMPGTLVAGTPYYVISVTSTTIQLATTLANALIGTAITIATPGVGYFTMSVTATQNIVNAAFIDIPEFASFIMQWVKCRLLEKRKDPTLVDAAATLVEQKQQMVNTLTEAIEDDDTEIEGDFSHYQEMS